MRGKKLSFGARSDGRAAGRRAAMTAVENSPEGARRTPEAGRKRGDASFLSATPLIKMRRRRAGLQGGPSRVYLSRRRRRRR